MSMNRCKCEKIYDTDFEMEEINGEMVCDNCFDAWQEEQAPRICQNPGCSKPAAPDLSICLRCEEETENQRADEIEEARQEAERRDPGDVD